MTVKDFTLLEEIAQEMLMRYGELDSVPGCAVSSAVRRNWPNCSDEYYLELSQEVFQFISDPG